MTLGAIGKSAFLRLGSPGCYAVNILSYAKNL